MAFKAEPRTLVELFSPHRFWAVPDFQREYVWGTKQVQTLLADLDSALFTDHGEDYFLGVIVSYPDPGTDGAVRYLVDGQQRMATLFALLCALRDRVNQLNLVSPGDQDGREFLLYLEQFLRGPLIVRGRSQGPRNRLTLQSGDLDRTLDELRQGHGAELRLPRGGGSRRLGEAYRRCRAYVENLEDDLEALRTLYYRLTNQVMFVDVDADNIDSAYKVFETLNDRGKTLDAADLLKNLMFYTAHGQPERERSVRENWHEVERALKQAPESSKVRFLRYVVVANHLSRDARMVQAADLFDWIRGHPQDFGTANPVALSERLAGQARAYSNFLRGLDLRAQPVASLKGIVEQGLGVRQHLPLLLAARGMAGEPFERLCKALETLTLVLAVTRQPWNQLETRLPAWCEALRAVPAEGGPRLDDFLAEHVEPLIRELGSVFWRNLDRTDLLRDSLVRYLLLELEKFVRGEARMAGEPPDDVTVEHIFPQGPMPENVREFFGVVPVDGPDAEETFKEAIYSIGNLALLTKNENSVADRRLYADKRMDPYPNTNFLITKHLAVDLRMGVATGINHVVEAYGLYPEEAWTLDAQQRRRASIHALIQARWPLIPSPES